MSRLLFYIISINFLLSCASNTGSKINSNQIDTLKIPTETNTIYFPFPNYTQAELKNNVNVMDSFVYNWYSKMLFALSEPVLPNYLGENEIYRFTLLRTFDNPITIRIHSQGDNVQLFSKVTNGAGGYEPGEIVWDTTLNLSGDEWKSLNHLIDQADFWNLPVTVNDGGNDGAEWILEGRRKKLYHWVTRWSPDNDRHPNFRKVCDYLIAVSKVPLTSKRVY